MYADHEARPPNALRSGLFTVISVIYRYSTSRQTRLTWRQRAHGHDTQEPSAGSLETGNF
jgi:hypothetical protein